MDFTLPEDLRDYLAELDEFIEREIKPLERQDDNIRFFDHRFEDVAEAVTAAAVDKLTVANPAHLALPG